MITSSPQEVMSGNRKHKIEKQLLNHIATEWRFFSKRIFQTPFLQTLVPVYRGEDYFCIFANEEKEPPMAAIFYVTWCHQLASVVHSSVCCL
jgi:hypothetical protein